MRLPALEFLERAEPRILVVQPDHEAHSDLVVFHVVHERAAVGVVVQRPAGAVQHQPGLVARRVDLPQFLDADAVGLRVAPFVQLEARDQLPAEVAARALGEDGVLGVQFHAELEAVGRLAVLADAHVAGGHALDRAVLVVEHLGGRETREDLHAQALGLLGQPACEVGQAQDVVAVVVEALGQQEIGRAAGALLAGEEEDVLGHRLVQRRAQLLPVGKQLVQRARVHDRAREDVGAGLRALFQHHHRHVLAVLGRELLEPDRRGQAGRAAAHHHHVVFHGFARSVLRQYLFVGHRALADNGS